MNGLIIQWKVSDGSGGFTWNLPITMSNTNYVALCNGGASSKTQTTVICSDTNPGSTYKCQNDCIVIGY